MRIILTGEKLHLSNILKVSVFAYLGNYIWIQLCRNTKPNNASTDVDISSGELLSKDYSTSLVNCLRCF